jgi:hypothetical protein
VVKSRPLLAHSFCSRAVLGVPPHATRAQIRARYFELAKATHPDTNPEVDAGAFLQIQAAFEELLAAQPEGQQRAPTAANAAARGGGPSAQRRERPTSPRSTTQRRPPTYADILCQRLSHDPPSYSNVWADIMEKKEFEVSAAVACALFRAAASAGGGVPAAMDIFHEAQAKRMLSRDARTASLVVLLTLCEEAGAMDTTMELCDLITEDDRTPEVLAALSSSFSCGIHG